MMLQKISISNKCCSFEFYIPQKNPEKFSTCITNRCFLETNQHIIMISEGSCDTEDWSNDDEILPPKNDVCMHVFIYIYIY